MVVEFRGNAPRLALIGAGYLALTAAVGAYVLVGDAWPRFFFFSFLSCAVPIGGICLLLHWLDRIALDDTARLIRRPLRPAVPYDSIDGFRVHNAGGMVSLTTARGRPILLYSFDRSSEERLQHEMLQRWPDGEIRRSSSSSRWLLVALVALPVALGSIYSWRLAERFEGLREPCQPVDWSMESGGPRDQPVGPFTVGVPAGFALRPGGMMLFGSDTADIVYSIEPATDDALARAVLRYGLGVEGSAEMIRWGACATSGALPLTAKAGLFGAESTERLVFDGGVAVLRQSKNGGNALLAFVGPQDSDLIVTVDFVQTIDNELLERIISLVGIGPQRLARRTD